MRISWKRSATWEGSNRSNRRRRSKSAWNSSPWLKQAGLGGDQLSEQLAELSQLDETGIGIVMKIALGKRAQPHELNVVLAEKSKIALAYGHHN